MMMTMVPTQNVVEMTGHSTGHTTGPGESSGPTSDGSQVQHQPLADSVVSRNVHGVFVASRSGSCPMPVVSENPFPCFGFPCVGTV